MKRKALLAALLLSLVVGLGGIAVAAPSSDVTAKQLKASEVQAYMENQDMPSADPKAEVSSEKARATQVMTQIREQMMDFSKLTEEQLENMPLNTQQKMIMNTQQEMPMNDQIDEMKAQMKNTIHQTRQEQSMAGTPKADNAQQGQKSSSNTTMSSMGKMGR